LGVQHNNGGEFVLWDRFSHFDKTANGLIKIQRQAEMEWTVLQSVYAGKGHKGQ
jgi:hypothetical protein